MVKHLEGVRLYRAQWRRTGRVRPVSALERASMTELPDNTKVRYELRTGRDGRQSAVDLKKNGWPAG